MTLTRKEIEEIMGLLDASAFGRLRLEMDGVVLELERQGAAPSAATNRDAIVPRGIITEPAPASAPSPPSPTPPPPAREGLVEVRSPLLGIYYRAPKPGEPPFVEVGSRVAADTVIGIVEVMKLMNSARAGVSGEVVEILATNGEMVEHGEVLMLVRPD